MENERTMTYTEKDHTFAVCAYRESPYLAACIESLLAQESKSQLIIATSTPNAVIEEAARVYGLPLYVNPEARGIAADWNFAYQQAETPLITLAHQDDLYQPGYLKSVLSGLNHSRQPLIAFTGYREYRGNQPAERNRNLRIKDWMLTPLRPRFCQRSRFVRRRILAFGNPICCPAVTYVRRELPEPVFESGFKSNVDWQAWERLSRLEGSFVYLREPLMYHRIHGGSETTSMIRDAGRSAEDLEMFRRFWPEPVARLLARIYRASERSNNEP